MSGLQERFFDPILTVYNRFIELLEQLPSKSTFCNSIFIHSSRIRGWGMGKGGGGGPATRKQTNGTFSPREKKKNWFSQETGKIVIYLFLELFLCLLKRGLQGVPLRRQSTDSGQLLQARLATSCWNRDKRT